MALNYSHRPIFSDHTSEDKVDRVDRSSSPESSSRDIIELLPSDPFGMDIETTFTCITGWLEDLKNDYGAYVRSNGDTISQETYDLLSRCNFIWNSHITLQSFQRNIWFDNQDSEEPLYMSHEVEGDVNSEGLPHDALEYTLRCLELKDLLTVERVCKSLKFKVQDDTSLWMNIHIDRPLNERITDDILVRLASKAQGSLKSLNVVDCTKITDEGLWRILEKNPQLTKLSVPGCTRLSISNIIQNIKAHNNSKKNGLGINQLRIGGVFGVTREHFKELNHILGVGHEKLHKSRFYHRGNFYLPSDDERAIDIDVCPRCEKIKLVYDCPAEECRVKEKSGQICRGCLICIPRCANCGRCVNDSEYEETFCLQLLCSECCKGMPEYQDKKIEPSGALRLNIESR